MSTCRLCNAVLARTWTARDAKSGRPLPLAICDRCGLVQQAELPRDEQLNIYYSHHYREDYKATHRPRPKHVVRAGRAALDRLAFMERAGIPAGSRLLDIGAGGGEFCYLAGRPGFAAEGIEPHLGYSDFARDHYAIRVQTCGIDDAPAQGYDVVTLFHVFEHLAHPQQAMARIWSLLGEGGSLVIEVPNICAADASPHNIYFFAHLFYYSRHSLAAAASRYFEVTHLEDKGNLLAAMRRRAEPLESVVFPSSADVAFTQERLARKGWLEYLLRGGGWRKPWRRVCRMRDEVGFGDMTPRQALDAVWQARGDAPMPRRAERPQPAA